MSIFNGAINFLFGGLFLPSQPERQQDDEYQRMLDMLYRNGFKSVLGLQGYAEGFDPKREYEFMRVDWHSEPVVYRLDDQSPYLNIANLFYREITQ